MILALMQPIYGWIPVEHYVSMMALTRHLCAEGIGFRHFVASSSLVQRARTRVVVEAAESGLSPDVYAWIDSDMVFSPANFDRLLGSLTRFPIVSGRYLVKGATPQKVCAFRRIAGSAQCRAVSVSESGMVEVDATGLGFCAMRSEVLLSMIREHGYRVFETHTLETGDVIGEDVTFFEKAGDLGFTVRVDLDNPVGHYGGAVA